MVTQVTVDEYPCCSVSLGFLLFLRLQKKKLMFLLRCYILMYSGCVSSWPIICLCVSCFPL